MAVCAAVAALWGLASPGLGVAALWFVCAGGVVSVVMWVATRALMSGWQATAFTGVADIGVGVALSVLTDRHLMFAGCMLFVVIGGFVTIHVPTAGLVIHGIFVAAFTCNAAVLMVVKGSGSTAVAALGTIVWLWVLVGAPIAVRRIWVGTSAAADMANIDPLTGVLNRAGLDDAYQALADLADHDDATMVVVVVDLDNFKAVNDQYGHHVGDAVIIDTAHQLAGHYGHAAAVARCGGEEFTVIAIGGADELDELVHTTPTATPGVHGPRVTMSVGAVTCDYRAGHDPLRQAMATADHAMYTAKWRGGNTIHHRTHPRPHPDPR